MYILKKEELEIGDIILIRSNSDISITVRERTGSQYSHAILYVGLGSTIDSDGYGVQSNNIQRLLFENEDDQIVLRLKVSPNQKQIQDVENFARQKIGTEYSMREALLSQIRKDIEAKEPNRQFCTRFITQAYNNAGIKLVDNIDYCTPEEILQSKELYIVENIIRKASEKEIEFSKTENPLEKQMEIHNEIFKKARQMSGKDIQTFEQVNELIIEQEDLDEELTNFIENSGYLTMMEKDEEKNPWHYNAEKMVEHYKIPELIINTAIYFAQTEAKTRERLLYTIYTLKQLNKVYPRKYFQMEIKLYEKLINYSHTRENEALKVLKYF